jgi:hypothetical protein
LATASLSGWRYVVTAAALLLAFVALVYGLFFTMQVAGVRTGVAAMLVTAASSVCLSMLAFGLALGSLASEYRGGTAEALVLTPASKVGIIAGRMHLVLKLMCLSALLLPLYCCTPKVSQWGMDYDHHSAQAHIVGLLSRATAAAHYWGDTRGAFPSVLTGIFALAADFSWYLMFASCGLFAAVWSRERRGGWMTGLLLVVCVMAALACYDSVVVDTMFEALPLPSPTPPRPWGWGTMHSTGFPCLGDPLLLLVWTAPSVIPRLVAYQVFLRMAGRYFDRIAQD